LLLCSAVQLLLPAAVQKFAVAQAQELKVLHRSVTASEAL
jgi:hypothetical protein